jgi:8-oxo-dGTP diphosphatase
MDKFDQKLTSGISLIQLRSKTILNTTFIAELYNKCKHNSVKLLLNTANKTFNEPSGDGWHLTTNEMLQLNLAITYIKKRETFQEYNLKI